MRLRNEAYCKWLGSGRQDDLNKFKEVRCKTRSAMSKAIKEHLVPRQGRAKLGEVSREKGIIQCASRWLLPVKVVTVEDEDGV